MPREVITIQVGQCGNQVGCRFWDLLLREHANVNPRAVYDDGLSCCFRNVDTRYDDPLDIPIGNGTAPIKALKARAVLVDMEEGVIDQMARGPLADVFDMRQRITSVSGAGNNWAHGHEVYGPRYAEDIMDRIRRAAEHCESLQCFSLVHSMGGGTGSGLGTYLLPQLADNYPDVYRFVTCTFPSADDDVITSPYNTILALDQLIDHADCVLPADNGALATICRRSSVAPVAGKGRTRPTRSGAFDEMNDIIASLLANLTASMRFEGALNVDLNEIGTNLVPFPRMHFLLSSMAPLQAPRTVHGTRADHMFTEAFARDNLLLEVRSARSARCLAAAMLARGSVTVSEMSRNLARLRSSIDMIHWNEDGFKLGLCRVPPVDRPRAILCLFNSCSIGSVFANQMYRFQKLYHRGAHLHHYTQYMDAAGFDSAAENVKSLIGEYDELQSAPVPREEVALPLANAIALR